MHANGVIRINFQSHLHQMRTIYMLYIHIKIIFGQKIIPGIMQMTPAELVAASRH